MSEYEVTLELCRTFVCNIRCVFALGLGGINNTFYDIIPRYDQNIDYTCKFEITIINIFFTLAPPLGGFSEPCSAPSGGLTELLAVLVGKATPISYIDSKKKLKSSRTCLIDYSGFISHD